MLCDCIIQVTPPTSHSLTWPVPDQGIFWAIDGTKTPYPGLHIIKYTILTH